MGKPAVAVKTPQQLEMELARQIKQTEWAAGRGSRLTETQKYIGIVIELHLDTWALYVAQALDKARLPEDERSSIYWFLSLVGNLVWAATVLIPTPVTGVGLAAKLMSFGGAAVGSGTVEKVLEGQLPDSPMDAKEWLGSELRALHADLIETYKFQAPAWANELELTGLSASGLEKLVNVYVWTKMYSKDIPYAKADEIGRHFGRFNAIYFQTKNNIEILLKEFDRQWKDYLDKKLDELSLVEFTQLINSKKALDFTPDLKEQLKAIQSSIRR